MSDNKGRVMGQLEIFADFALAIAPQAVPQDVLDYSKIVLMDTLVCGLAAARLERSRITGCVASRLGDRKSVV